MRTLSIDPGIRGVGAAYFVHGRLYECLYVKNPILEGDGPFECLMLGTEVARRVVGVDILAVEWPQTYGGRAAKGDTNDLLPLIGVNVAIVSHYQDAEIRHFRPREWKGGIPKGKDNAVIESRVRGRLDESELKALEALVCPKNLRHNVIDAIGIGLHALGRFERKRVFPRE